MTLCFNEYSKNRDFKKVLIDSYGTYKVFRVDGKAVRDSSLGNEEFGEYDTFIRLPNLIPHNEIWIENDVPEKEYPFLIKNALTQIKYFEQGMSKTRAYDKGTTAEKKMRQIVNHPKNKKSPIPSQIYIKKYGQLDNMTVWLVNAKIVRETWKIDFTEGGNNGPYHFIPSHQIWLENGLRDDELPYILLHEFSEMCLMKIKKMDYHHAHDIASKIEFNIREHGRFSKSEALAMTEDEALALSKRFTH